METVFLGLGSNLGNRERNIEQVISELQNIGMIIEKTSSIIETEPLGGPPQGKFLNAVLKGKTDIPPEELLQEIKAIETKLGRVDTGLNGPRPIDIDILLYANHQITTPNLTIPHPRMFDRDFVMTPLNEIEPGIAAGLSHENS